MAGIDKLGVKELLSARRKALDLSLEQMADKIDLTYSALWRAENDPGVFPQPDVAAKICQGYGVSLAEYLLAAGYDFGPTDTGEAIRTAILKDAPLAEYVSTHYNIIAGRMVADLLEPSILHQKKKERATYDHPVDADGEPDLSPNVGYVPRGADRAVALLSLPHKRPANMPHLCLQPT